MVSQEADLGMRGESGTPRGVGRPCEFELIRGSMSSQRWSVQGWRCLEAARYHSPGAFPRKSKQHIALHTRSRTTIQVAILSKRTMHVTA